MFLDPKKVEASLREFISREVDYDIHKQIENDEETGEDLYPDLAKKFIGIYNSSKGK